MKKIVALGLTLVMLVLTFTACGEKTYDFYTVSKDRKSIDIKLKDDMPGYHWTNLIGAKDKIRLVKEKEENGFYTANFETIRKSGKGKKSGRMTIAFQYVSDKNPNDVYLGYVLGANIDSNAKLKEPMVDEMKVNFQTTLAETK